MMEKIKRSAAVALGSKQYFTGKPCCHGHIATRAAVNGFCSECARLKQNKRYHALKEDPEFRGKIRDRQSGFRAIRAEENRAKRAAASAVNSGKQVIWRKAARQLGLAKYFTGNPCSHGHVTERTVSDGACVECASIKSKRQYVDNRDWIRIRTAAWQKNHRDRLLAKATAWRAANKDQVGSFRRNRRARERNAEGHHDGADIAALMKSQRCICACGCGANLGTIGFEVDHKMPISRGGSNWPTNLQLLTPSCNRSKNDKTMEEWMSCKLGIRAATLIRMQFVGE